MKIHRWEDIEKRALTAKQRARVEKAARKELLEMNLRAVRELLGKTQTDVAQAAKMSQSELSKAERREDHLLSTLRRVVHALGGELEVIANFGDKKVRLLGV